MERLKELKFSKKFAVLVYKGTFQASTHHQIIFESDNPREVMKVLEDMCAIPVANIGYMVIGTTCAQADK